MEDFVIRNLEGEAVCNLLSMGYEELSHLNWSEVLNKMLLNSGQTLRRIDFTSLIDSKVSVRNGCFEECVFDFDKMEKSSLVGCKFRKCRFKRSSFHHFPSKEETLEVSMHFVHPNHMFLCMKFE